MFSNCNKVALYICLKLPKDVTAFRMFHVIHVQPINKESTELLRNIFLGFYVMIGRNVLVETYICVCFKKGSFKLT